MAHPPPNLFTSPPPPLQGEPRIFCQLKASHLGLGVENVSRLTQTFAEAALPTQGLFQADFHRGSQPCLLVLSLQPGAESVTRMLEHRTHLTSAFQIQERTRPALHHSVWGDESSEKGEYSSKQLASWTPSRPQSLTRRVQLGPSAVCSPSFPAKGFHSPSGEASATQGLAPWRIPSSPPFLGALTRCPYQECLTSGSLLSAALGSPHLCWGGCRRKLIFLGVDAAAVVCVQRYFSLFVLCATPHKD